MKKVYICSPYRPTGQNPEAERKRNVEKAQTACRLAIDAGYLPLAPHLYFTQMLNDDETNEDSKEVKTDTLNLQATPLANGYVKAKTGTNTTDDVYNKWYDAVYEPQAEAVDTEDTSHTEEPQG